MSTRHAAAVAVVAVAFTAVGCASDPATDPDQGASPPPTPGEETVTQTVTRSSEVRAEPPTQSASGTGNESDPASTPPGVPQPTTSPTGEACVTDVLASEFGPAVRAGRVPLGELGEQPWQVQPVEGFYYHFQIGEDGYDSCAPLSYVSVVGSNGDAAGSAGIGAAIADAVVFFTYGDLITQPAPFQMKTVEQVTRLSPSELTVRYGHTGGATAQGVTEYYQVRFFHDGGLSAAGDLPDGIDGHARLYLR